MDLEVVVWVCVISNSTSGSGDLLGLWMG